MRQQSIHIEVLGESRIVVDGVAQPMPGGRPGLLLQALLLHPNEAVPAADLVEALWPEVAPHVGVERLRVTATRLRRHLGDGIGVEATPGGYRLVASSSSIDRLVLEALARRAQEGDIDAAHAALALWRGEPYLDFAAFPNVERERRQLVTLRTWLEAVVAGADEDPAVAMRLPSPLVAPVETGTARPRLLDRLPPVGAVRMIALTAPAGYGKSVLLAQWAERERPLVAWMRLTPKDNELIAFRNGLVTALHIAGGPLPGDLAGDETPHWVAHLVNQLVGIDGPLGIVLDDVHHITNPAVHADLHELVRQGPEHLTVAVASRQSLPFPTSLLRASGKMLALTPADLAFTLAELATALESAGHDRDRVQTLVEPLCELTAGWPEAALAVAAADAAKSWVARDPAMTAWAAASDLLDRVLHGLAPSLVALLVDTAHLDTLSARVCDAVTGRASTAPMLDTLATRHHLLTRVGDSYRRHRLLAKALRHRQARRGAAHVAWCHALAARWYLDHDEPDTALHHAATAEDPCLISSALGEAVLRAAARGDALLLRRWAATVPLPFPTAASDHVVEIALLAAALLPRHQRGHWAPHRSTRVAQHLAATIDAVDLLREGRCAESLVAVEQARNLHTRLAPETADLVETLLAVTEADDRLLLGDPADPGNLDCLLPSAEAAPWQWPWFTIWAFGRTALHAYISGDPQFATALLDHVAARCNELHSSWPLLTDGSAYVTRGLIDSDRAQTIEQQHRAVESLQAVVRQLDDAHLVPMGIIARYALQRAHQRAGDETAAASRLAEADAARDRYGQLVFLEVVRTRLHDDSAGTAPGRVDRLSPSELAVLDCLDSDLTLAEIAGELYLSVHTVKAHTRSIYRKLGVTRRAHAVASARSLQR